MEGYEGWIEGLRRRVNQVFSRWLPWRKEKDEKRLAKFDGANGRYILQEHSSPLSFVDPKVDIIDEGEKLRVLAELPGLTADDFEVKLEGRRLFLRGEKRSEREENKGSYRYRECSFGAFSRVVPLPAAVLTENPEARYNNGILEIELTKKESIKVNVN